PLATFDGVRSGGEERTVGGNRVGARAEDEVVGRGGGSGDPRGHAGGTPVHGAGGRPADPGDRAAEASPRGLPGAPSRVWGAGRDGEMGLGAVRRRARR